MAANDTTISDAEYVEAWAAQDGGSIPCSRYGRRSEDMVPFLLALVDIFAKANGEPMTDGQLEHFMSLLVNDHDDPEALIREHGDPSILCSIDLHTFDDGAGRVNAMRHCLYCSARSLDYDDEEDEI